MNREKLEISLSAAIKQMTENNSAAAGIIDELIQTKGETIAHAILIILDDMNIRGMQIQSLYKMCGQNIEDFYEKTVNITKEDIEKLNSLTFAINKYKALLEGTSSDRYKNPEKYLFTDEERNSMRNKKSKDMVHDILENKSKKELDLRPDITSKEALNIINKYGFTCGYKKTYENKEKQKITYRVFYNEYNDILYTKSIEEPDIFLWGKAKLNILRKYSHKNYKDIKANVYLGTKGLISYSIDLKENPFKEYQKILNRKEEPIKEIKKEYFDETLIPIIESKEALIYKENSKSYKEVATANIYNLLTFKETYYDLNDELKKIYKPLFDSCEEKAYDEIIKELNADEGIEIAQKIQNVLGINLDKRKLIEARERYQNRLHQKFDSPKEKILKYFIEIPEEKNIKEKISKIAEKIRP